MWKKRNRHLIAKLATEGDEITSALRLRHRVFIGESCTNKKNIEQNKELDWDQYENKAEHLVLIDKARFIAGRHDYVVGTCRIIVGDLTAGPQQFYSNSEFFLDNLVRSSKRFLEVGRACVDNEYRAGEVLFLLWKELVKFLNKSDIEAVFGVASFKGVAPSQFADALSFLYFNYLSKEIIVNARPEGFVELRRMPVDRINSSKAKKQLPSLLKAYLACGGWVGHGGFLDSKLQTLDVFVCVGKAQILQKYRFS